MLLILIGLLSYFHTITTFIFFYKKIDSILSILLTNCLAIWWVIFIKFITCIGWFQGIYFSINLLFQVYLLLFMFFDTLFCITTTWDLIMLLIWLFSLLLFEFSLGVTCQPWICMNCFAMLYFFTTLFVCYFHIYCATFWFVEITRY